VKDTASTCYPSPKFPGADQLSDFFAKIATNVDYEADAINCYRQSSDVRVAGSMELLRWK